MTEQPVPTLAAQAIRRMAWADHSRDIRMFMALQRAADEVQSKEKNDEN